MLKRAVLMLGRMDVAKQGSFQGFLYQLCCQIAESNCQFLYQIYPKKIKMPILFKTSYRYSPISGLGLFADEDIPKGAVWWTFNPNVQGIHCQNAPNLPNIVLGREDVEEFTRDKNAQELTQLVEHTMYYPDADKLIVLRDGSGCINHSFEPNSQIIYNPENDCTQLHSKTLHEIKAGQEITQNYGNYCKLSNNWSEQFFRKYMPSRLEFEADFEIKKVSS